MIHNVVFDMDGVLFDTERISSQSWAIAAQEVGIPELAEAIQDYFGLNATDSRALFTSTYGDRLSYDEWVRRTKGRSQRYIDENGLPVKRGVRELLTYLRDAGIGVALATSTRRERAVDYLQRADLLAFFQQIVTGDMVLHGKPAPDIYRLACERLGANPAETIAVEDSYNGLRAAATAGMLPVMVPDMKPYVPELEKTVYRVCDSLLDVIDLIEDVNRR